MPLLERDDALATLRQALDVAHTTGQLVSVAGEAGIGKSTLLREFADQQLGRARAVWGYCEALFTARPLGPVLDMAPRLGRHTAAALTDALPPHALFAGVMADLGALPPTIAVFEDVHWADEATLDLLQFVGRRIEQTRAVVIVSWRDDEVGPDHPLHRVQAGWPGHATHRIRLRPLSLDAVQQLAGTSRDAAAVHALTSGNPFFVTEVLEGGQDRVPASVRDAVLARRSRLDLAAREALDLVAVVPARAEIDVMEAALGHTAGLEGCLSAGLLSAAGSIVQFRHELARMAVLESLSAPRLRDNHRRVLQVLAQRHDRPRLLAQLVHHADAAGDAEAVGRYAPEAARQAAALGAHRQAVEHYARALRNADALAGDTRAGLQEALAYEHYLTGDIEAARTSRREALDTFRREGQRAAAGRNIRWLSRLAWFVGDRAEADLRAAEAVQTLETAGDGAELAMAYSNRAQLAMLSDDTASCLEWGEKAIALARSVDAIDVLSHALNNVGSTLVMAGEARGQRLLEESLQIALDRDLHEHAARAYTNLGSQSAELRQLAAARRWLDEGVVYCQARDLDAWIHYMRAWRARVYLELGLWPAARDEADAVLAAPRSAPVSRMPALAALGLLRVRRGDADAEAPLAEALVLARQSGESQRLAPVLLALAEFHWMAGRKEAASAAVDEALATLPPTRHQQQQTAWYWRWKSTGQRPPATTGDGPWLRLLGGDWQAAADQWRDIGAPYEQALALLEGGRDGVHQAFELFHGLGAVPAADWARQRLRELGVTQVPRGKRASTLSHPAGLTARESEILALLAHGLSNPQIGDRLFVSAKTIEHHVSSILAKLDVATRDAAVATARRHGWLPERRLGVPPT